MNKSQRLIEMLRYINTKKFFTAQNLAQEFNISIRTVHRNMLELAEMGVYFYTEQGKNGGYRLISSSILPPVNFTEDEVIAIFFALQSLTYYSKLPFEADIDSVSRKLYINAPLELQNEIDRLKSKLLFKSVNRNLPNTYLKELLNFTDLNSVIEIKYNSRYELKKYSIVPICVYSNNGFWYVPSYDTKDKKIKHFRVDRIIKIKDTEEKLSDNLQLSIDTCFNYQITEPVRLYIELDKNGIRQCMDNEFIGKNIHINSTGQHGYIDEVMDLKEIKYLGDFFIQLGTSAKIIEPMELKQYIINKAKQILNIYD